MNDKDFINKLSKHADETVTLLSNAQKAERERMVVRAFLRCIGLAFADDEIRAGECEPTDVRFRCANFQVMVIIGDRRPHDAWRQRKIHYENAKNLSDVVSPCISPKAISFKEVYKKITTDFARKSVKYGATGCARLDALAYVDFPDRFLYPPESDSSCREQLISQGWRSVSMLVLPYGCVLTARDTSPEFLRDRSGLILNAWKNCDGLFDPD